ncbi:hypothetical protein [Pseudemcibacter aquimaris]|uniref:hypothetical protein n=1 Tax=Pseudemcibacter aquimaris TaxID=2857064 RepID=UPI0020128C0F|nr:hypothetical protein [Pseudemcibacter aquimaris]MCC3859863.1 hypothetical protein [Pseudemcibacter aquimaris]WDU57195.1 hypothetical protein KW060_08290 [Pseudemcibacter aquimaris]
MANFTQNWKLIIFAAVLFTIGAVMMVDAPVNVGTVDAEISTAVANGPTQELAVFAKFPNGVQVKIQNFPIDQIKEGRKIRLDHFKTNILGYNTYKFIGFIEEG